MISKYSSDILPVDFLSKYVNKQPKWGFNGLGYIVYKRTYARKLEDGTMEEWWQTVARCINGAQKIGANYTPEEAQRLYDYVFNLKGNFAGRMLWQLGTPLVERFMANSLLNCLAGDTPVLTREGWKLIAELAGKTATIVTKNGKWVEAPFYHFGDQETYEIVFKSRTTETVIRATAEHRWFVLDENKNHVEKTTLQLKVGDLVPVLSKEEEFAEIVSITPTNKVEPVYCAVVPETHSFVIDGNILTGNCWFIAINSIDSFCFLFENLMLGGGVGFSVRREHIYQLPKVKKGVTITHQCTKDADFIVPDSREGWVKLLRNVLKSFFETGESFTYSTILVRGYGEPIKGFGGTASGPQILIEGIENICKIMKNREGKKLRSVDALDICNIIGLITVAGNIRRTAQIAIGDPDDYLYLRAKRWDLGNIPNWRAMSNNTIYIDDYSYIQDQVWDGYNGNGEPYGFFNLPLSQEYGRLREKVQDNCDGLNPCGEITLSNYECCNLAELYLPNIESKEEMLDIAKLLYKTQKAIAAMRYIHKETEEIVHKNMRLGLGVTGVCQAIEKLEWCNYVYRELRNFDKEWSKERGWNKSIKLTTVKPSGTLSLLAGVTPGVHPGYSHYFIRRVRMSSDDPLVSYCKGLGFRVEYVKNFDGTEDRRTVVVEFPCKFDENTIVAKDMKAVDQLELIKKLQTVWSDNAVSCTVYYRKEELPEIKEWLKNNYETSIKSVSFLLHSDHGFTQAPYEEITKEKYEELVKKVKPIQILNNSVGSDFDDLECSTGVCPIK